MAVSGLRIVRLGLLHRLQLHCQTPVTLLNLHHTFTPTTWQMQLCDVPAGQQVPTGGTAEGRQDGIIGSLIWQARLSRT